VDEKRLEKLRAVLNDQHQWPSIFIFKFIIPSDESKLQKLKLIFGEAAEFTAKQSKKGTYTSLTVKEMILDADSVFHRYTEASKIEGIIAL
jgi:putative lipoic acid-binding regulatory protein